MRVKFNDPGDVISIDDFISGWLQGEKVIGRPAAVLAAKDGSIIISDDYANLLYKVSYKK